MDSNNDIFQVHDIEMLVRYVDKTCDYCEDANEIMTKKGDVIAYKKIPCSWSQREYENPDWRILKANNVTEYFMSGLVQPELPEAGISEETHVLRRRGAYIEFSLLPADLQIEIDNDQEMSRSLTDVELYAAYKSKGTPKLRANTHSNNVISSVIG